MIPAKKYESKIYNYSDCCVFRKTKEGYGALSNMAAGFPLGVNGIPIKSAEALYQACRFPHLPDIQVKILQEKSPMTAKMVGKPFREMTRPDWEEEKVKIMRWCLRVKLAQHYVSFGKVLECTFNKQIVEESNKDAFWGAIPDKHEKNVLKGVNALGRLLMELRQAYNEKRYLPDLFYIEPLKIPDFKLLGQEISIIDERLNFLHTIQRSLGINGQSPITKTEPPEIIRNTTIKPPVDSGKSRVTKKKALNKPNGEQGSLTL
jgi:ribA/ribD-fused uncharacterized protein